MKGDIHMAERIKRSVEERVAEIDSKIAKHKSDIANLEARKEAILNPKPRITKAGKIKAVIDIAKKSGMSPEEIAEKLGVTIE